MVFLGGPEGEELWDVGCDGGGWYLAPLEHGLGELGDTALGLARVGGFAAHEGGARRGGGHDEQGAKVDLPGERVDLLAAAASTVDAQMGADKLLDAVDNGAVALGPLVANEVDDLLWRGEQRSAGLGVCVLLLVEGALEHPVAHTAYEAAHGRVGCIKLSGWALLGGAHLCGQLGQRRCLRGQDPSPAGGARVLLLVVLGKACDKASAL